MRGHRILVSALIALGAALAAPAPASAEDYAPPAVDVPPAVQAGVAVTFSGTGFMPGTKITITAEYTSNSTAAHRSEAKDGLVLAALAVPAFEIGSTFADADGNFSTTITLPHSGTALVTGTGLDPNGVLKSVSDTITVAPSAAELAAAQAAADATLPVTGNSGDKLGTEIAVGTGAVVLGGVVIGLTMVRRRRTATEI